MNSGNVALNRKKRSQHVVCRSSSIEVYNPTVFSKKHFNLNNNYSKACYKFSSCFVNELCAASQMLAIDLKQNFALLLDDEISLKAGDDAFAQFENSNFK